MRIAFWTSAGVSPRFRRASRRLPPISNMPHCHECGARAPKALHQAALRHRREELVVELVDAAVQREESCAELLGLVVAEAPGIHAAHGLPLEQLSEDLDEDEDELGE